MLVFTLKEGEEFLIETPEGRLIKGVVVKIGHGQMRIGLDADRSVIIDRMCVAERRREAARAKGLK